MGFWALGAVEVLGLRGVGLFLFWRWGFVFVVALCDLGFVRVAECEEFRAALNLKP